MNAPEDLGSTLAPRWRERSFLQSLGPAFGTELAPRPVADPHWIARSDALARELGLAPWLEQPEALEVLAGQRVADGTRPYASVYSGHQFGAWAGQLGDGRARLLARSTRPLDRWKCS